MPPFFIFFFLVILGLACTWLLLSGLYRPLGRFVHRVLSDARGNMADESETAASSAQNPSNNASNKGDS